MSVPTADGAPVIVARGLARWYGPVIGLTDLDVEIPPGITGLLGPNGAGKSTFLRLVTGQIAPSDGTVRVLGCDPQTTPAVFHRVGFCSEDDALFEDLTPLETVTYLAACSGYSAQEAKDRAIRSLERAGIAHAMGRRCGTFSKGMRQRTRLAAALVHDPELLLLDEPMSGLDPVGRRDVVNLIRSLEDEGRSVLFSSHILHEVESVARHVVILNHGMALAEGTLGHIKECLSDYAFSLSVRCSDARRLARAIVEREHVIGITLEDEGRLTIESTSSRSLLTELPPLVLELGVSVEEITTPRENLESLFNRLFT